MPADAPVAARLRALARVGCVALLWALAGVASGCAQRPGAGAPRLSLGTPCETCGMELRDPRYACAVREADRVRVYDSIECAMRGAGGAARASVFLADFASGSLHAADSLWVVRADIPSPMGGGYAAFLDRGEAEHVAAERTGRAARLRDFLAVTAEARP